MTRQTASADYTKGDKVKLGTLRTYNGTVAVVVGATTATTIGGITDVGSLLKLKNWREVAFAASGGVYPLASIDPSKWAPPVPHPGKILCVGLNYRTHILEMGSILPA